MLLSGSCCFSAPGRAITRHIMPSFNAGIGSFIHLTGWAIETHFQFLAHWRFSPSIGMGRSS